MNKICHATLKKKLMMKKWNKLFFTPRAELLFKEIDALHQTIQTIVNTVCQNPIIFNSFLHVDITIKGKWFIGEISVAFPVNYIYVYTHIYIYILSIQYAVEMNSLDLLKNVNCSFLSKKRKGKMKIFQKYKLIFSDLFCCFFIFLMMALYIGVNVFIYLA